MHLGKDKVGSIGTKRFWKRWQGRLSVCCAIKGTKSSHIAGAEGTHTHNPQHSLHLLLTAHRANRVRTQHTLTAPALVPQRGWLFFGSPFTAAAVPKTDFIIILHSWVLSPLWLHTENWLLIRTLFKRPLVSSSSEAWEGNLIFTPLVPQATLWGTIEKEAVCGSQLFPLLA